MQVASRVRAQSIRSSQICFDSHNCCNHPCRSITVSHSSTRHSRCLRNQHAYSISRCLAVR
eukprot:1942714-Pleurochrysis_carterae.AAC.1